MASTSCKKGHVKINGIVARPSREVYIQDKIELRKDHRNYSLKVLDFPRSRVGAKLVGIYREDTTPIAELERGKDGLFDQIAKRDRGMGRPTKKERRDIDDFMYREEENE